MTQLENQLAEALRGFMRITNLGVGMTNLSSLEGRLDFYQKITTARAESGLVLAEYNRQRSLEQNQPY